VFVVPVRLTAAPKASYSIESVTEPAEVSFFTEPK
jgi:hypothetical protein